MSAKAPSQFRSKYKAMIVVARHGHDILHPVTGTKIDEVKRLSAEFGIHRGEYTVVDSEGREQTFADIAGYFYDLDADAEAKAWSDDEKEAMRTELVRRATSNPDYVQIYEAPAAGKPWPTYDSTHHNKIPVLAGELGLVQESILYERANKNRESVVAALEAVLVPQSSPPEPQVEELTAA